MIEKHQQTNGIGSGKMNILEFLKNGSGIHIKKKNRGNNDYINKMLNEIWKKN